MADPTYPIRMRYFSLQGLSKKEMVNICIENNYIYNPRNSKIQMNHFILKEEYPNEFDDFINFKEVDKEELIDRINELTQMTTVKLKNILKSYRLTQNGKLIYLVERIVKYEFYNKIITNDQQRNLFLYKIEKNLTYIPEINYMDNNYENNYDIDLLYRPLDFYNLDEYIKHMENLRILNLTNLIVEHLQEIPTNYINYICYHLNQNGWHFEDYDTIISNAVNEKYSEKESNNDIINNIPSFSFKTVNINNDVNNNDINNNGINDSKDKNCIVCMCEIEENEECKKLKCGHMFHSACIDNWLKRTLECPMCRNVIT